MSDEMRFSVFCDRCPSRIAWERHARDAVEEAKTAGWQAVDDKNPLRWKHYCPECAKESGE